ncbi:MAG TPA: BON domain-containing protein [Gemmatimonadaceae bacterium]|nr:BON domain-containing protein [Gemmatimonadaceae bacterium]
MSRFRYRDRDDSLPGTLAGLAVGAFAGFAVGVVLAQKVGGIAGITARVRDRLHRGGADELEAGYEDMEDYEDMEGEEDEIEEDDALTELEERVLEAFRNDPILSERAVDIGAIGEGVIELTGWVNEDDEAEHAVTLARGVPGVDTVVNRLAVGDEEELLEENARRVSDGDPALTGARWEGQRVGTGRRRQGTSDEPDRHADPKPELEERWLAEQHAIDEAAEDTAGLAERRRQKKNAAQRGDRTGGSPVAPTGVPKGDHVAEPEQAPDSQRII